MAENSFTQDNRIGRLKTSLGKDALLLLRMTAVERLSESFTIVIDAVSPEPIEIHKLLGSNVTVEIDANARPDLNRFFNGEVWEYAELGRDDEGCQYRLTVRPTTQFMTLNRRNRIFQAKSVPDIANELLLGAKSKALSASYAALEYCVQYQESDFDFVSRLLEYEGIYYYFTHADGSHELKLIDDRNSHQDLSTAKVTVQPRDGNQNTGNLWSVIERRGIGPTKVTVSDYDFEAPTTDLKKTKAAAAMLGAPTKRFGKSAVAPPGSWSSTSELYDYPGKYNVGGATTGTRYSEVWLDAHRRQMARSFAEGSLFVAATGKLLTVDFGGGIETEYLIVGTTHRYSSPGYHSSSDGGAEDLTVELELMPATDQYRPAQRTPRPRILGPQTAVVVGPSGEEIYTDKYGRIKVQFYWDRLGRNNENSGCFIRVVQAGAGKAWGNFVLPRIGQEVVVEFMDGDPDRPLVTGAVYNAVNTVPAALPENKTQFGMKSRITKGGGGFNHFWFEDKKDSEVVWFRAERDYKANIVNKDEERKYDRGNRKTTFMEGNDELIISKGKRTETIKMNDDLTVETGDKILAVKTGNRTATIDVGNDSLTVKVGNVDIKVSIGKHTTNAMQAIELICGGSTIKMDPMSISLESPTIKIKGSLAVQVEGLMVESKASAMSILKGAIVMIN